MEVHANAKLGPKGRLVMVVRVVDEGWSLAEAAAAAGVSDRTCRKWVGRFLAEGESGLLDRSSAPKVIANRTPERVVEAIAALRRLRFTGEQIADTFGLALSTVGGILARIGMGKRGRLGLEPERRYERERPGELVHIDIKKLGRIQDGAGHRVTGRKHYTPRFTDRDGKRRRAVGWDYVHVAV